MKKKFWQILFTAGLIISFSAGAFFVIFSDASQLVKIIPDDAFYYFKIAQNIAFGNGSTFDGINLANGYHPLWMALILPLTKFIKEPTIYLKSILLLEIVFHFAAVFLLCKILQKITKKFWLAFLGTCFYFFNPQVISSSLNGLETGISTFLLALLVYLVFFKKINSPAGGWMTGGLLGLLFLARTDNTFYIFAFLLVLSFRPSSDSYRSAWTNPFLDKNFLKCLIGFLIVISPWLVWNYLNFGSILQTSGEAVPMVLHANYLADRGLPAAVIFSLKSLVSFPVWGLYRFLGMANWLFWTLIIFSLSIVAVRWNDIGVKKIKVHLKKILILLGGSVLFIWTHGVWRWYPREWYFDGFLFLFAIFVTIAVLIFEPERVFKKIIASIYPKVKIDNVFCKSLIFIIVSFFLILRPLSLGIKRLRNGDYPHQQEMLEVAYWLRDNLKSDEKAGVFNAGITGFLSDKQIINLDGVVNDKAFAAVKAKNLSKFIKEQDVDYYLDWEPYSSDLYKLFWGTEKPKMTEITVFDNNDIVWEGSDVRVYKIEQ